MTKLNLKHLTRISVIKKFMKSQRERKTNVSTEFFASLQRYTHKLLVEMKEEPSFWKGKKMVGLPVRFTQLDSGFKTPLVSKTEVQKILKRTKIQMSSKAFKEFNDHIAHVCSISTKGTRDITIKKMLLVSVADMIDCVAGKPQDVQEASVAATGEQQSMEVHYEVTTQGVSFEGVYNVRTGYKKKKLEVSIINLVVRQLKSLGVLGSPVVQILSTEASS